VQRFCRQFLGLHISLGAIQKVINRASRAIKPHYEAIREQVYQSRVNHVDETPWYQASGVLQWLWVMGNSAAAFFLVHTKRNKKAFKDLIDKWEGILVSDNYGVYRNWVNLHQSCLSHLIRKAKGLAQHKNPEIAKCGTWARDELRKLVAMANEPPTKGQWRAFYARFCRFLSRYRDRKDQAGTYVRSLEKLMANLWVFLQVEDVEPTNNLAERLLRRAVIWRKRSMGTESETGDRWVERILTLTQTCRLQNRLCYPVLVGAMESHLQGTAPDLSWISKITAKEEVEATP
jgi:transposase